MADKKSPEELAREKKLEEELFSKTMGFTHTPSPEELERTVILTPATPQKPEQKPEPQDFESTVRFSNFDALVESTVSSNTDELKPEPSPTEVPPAKPENISPVSQPPAESPTESPVATTATPPTPEAAAPSKPAPAESAITPPEIGLDFTDSDFGLSTIETNDSELPTADTLDVTLSGIAPPQAEEETKEAVPTDIPEPQPAAPAVEDVAFDSGAALDELDELLNMDLQEGESSAIDDDVLQKAAIDITTDGDESDTNDDDVPDMDVNAMPTIQLSAIDIADDSMDDATTDSTSDNMDDEAPLLSDITDDNDELLHDTDSEPFADNRDNKTPHSAVTDEPEQENLLDLSGMEAALDDELEPGIGETASKATPADEANVPDEAPTTDEVEANTDDTDKPAEMADTFIEDIADETATSELETPELPLTAPVAKPELAASAMAEQTADTIPASAAAPTEKRKGSGFSIFLSLLALAGVGGLYWLNQASPQGSVESQLAQTADRMNQLQRENRQLAMQVDELKEKNESLEQRLNDLARVVANRTVAEQKKAVRQSRPVIKPSTPVKSARPSVAAPATPVTTNSWVINLTSVSSAESAEQEIARLQKLGIQATSVRTEARGKIWYRIRVGGYHSLAEAEAESTKLAEKLGIKDIWVGRP